MNRRYNCDLNIADFVCMLDDTTECYKFFWLESLVTLVAMNTEVITIENVIMRMIVNAWPLVTIYKLKLGISDKTDSAGNALERAVKKLDELKELPYEASNESLIDFVKIHKKEIYDDMYQLAKHVPYRALAPFMTEIKGTDVIWDQRKKLVEYISILNEKEDLVYTLGNESGLKKHVNIDDNWRNYLIDNYVLIRSWIQLRKAVYIQQRNPGVEGIIRKLGTNFGQIG